MGAGLCTRSSWVPEATNCCLKATGKNLVFHVSLNAGHQEAFRQITCK